MLQLAVKRLDKDFCYPLDLHGQELDQAFCSIVGFFPIPDRPSDGLHLAVFQASG